MKFNQLDITPRKRSNRVGRGIAGGQGKTAGRGTKGQKSRTGSSKKPGFQGGTNPLMQQLPKLPGFRSHRPKAVNVFTSDLEQLKIKVIDAKVLADKKLVSSPYARIKLLNRGDALKASLSVKLPSASQSAIDNIQKAGGSFEKVAQLQRPKIEKTDK